MSRRAGETDYFGWGLVIRSQLDVPGGWVLDRSERHRPDVTVRLGSAAFSGSRESRPPYEFGDGSILFDTSGVARYLIETDRIVVEPASSATAEHVSALLIATALPALLWLRGGFVLHASCAVSPDGMGMAFAGPSGSGKSLIGAALVEEGWGLAGDDSVALEPYEAQVRARGLPSLLHIGPSVGGAARPVLPVSPDRRRREAGLAAICRLRPAAGAALQATRLSSVSALTVLLAHRHRPAVPSGLKIEGSVLDRAAQVARSLSMLDLSFDPATIRGPELAQCLAEAAARTAA